MSKNIMVIGMVLFFTLTLFSSVFSEESFTITTYYPSPYGSYRQLYVSDNVGIGTTASGYSLEVARTSGNDFIALSGAETLYKDLRWRDTTSGEMWQWSHRAHELGNRFEAWYHNGTSWASVPTLSMTTAGNVGIGTREPNAKVEISYDPGGSTAEPQLRIFNPTNAAGEFAGIRFRTASGWDVRLGTIQGTAWLRLTDAAGVCQSEWSGSSYIPCSDNAGSIGTATRRWNLIRGVTITPGDLRFENDFTFTEQGEAGLVLKSPDGQVRMAFESTGNVGIGTTSPGTYKCYINGTGYLNAAAWVYGSDIRLKENISYIQSGLNVIEHLKPVKFDYINGDKKQVGFIAQEVQEILPDIVTEGTDGMLGMKTDSIIPYLVKAIQEQQKEIEALKAKLNAGQ